jgi:hypothetical protein
MEPFAHAASCAIGALNCANLIQGGGLSVSADAMDGAEPLSP